MRWTTRLVAGFVLSCTSVAAAKPCTASGVFSAGNVFSFYFWDLHDRAGEISGAFRYYAWNLDVDVGAPSVRQSAAVSGSRKGNDLVLAVADPLGRGILRKVHATLKCFPPERGDLTSAALAFPVRPREYRERQVYTRAAGPSPIPMMLRGMTKQMQSFASLQKPMRERARHDPALRARIDAAQVKLLHGASYALDEMAAVTPQ